MVPPIDDTENKLDRPRLIAKVTVSPARHTCCAQLHLYIQEPIYKSEVVDQLDTVMQARLDENDSYKLYNNLTSARFMRSCMLLMDAREPVARLSELTQRDGLRLAALDRKLIIVQEEIEALMTKPGANEATFIKGYDASAEVSKGTQVLNQGTGEYAKDREQYLKALSSELKDPELDMQDPVSLARKKLFDFVKWERGPRQWVLWRCIWGHCRATSKQSLSADSVRIFCTNSRRNGVLSLSLWRVCHSHLIMLNVGSVLSILRSGRLVSS